MGGGGVRIGQGMGLGGGGVSCLQERIESGLLQPSGAGCSSLVWSWGRMTFVYSVFSRMGCRSCRCCFFSSSICCLMVLAGSWS